MSFDADTGGEGCAVFDRTAPSALDAIVSAVEQGQACGLDVTGVSDDLVTLGEVAERIGRTLAAVDHWVRGRRGPGGFPAPRVPRNRAALWSWADVAGWLATHRLADISPEDLETARICRAVDMVLRASHQVSLTHDRPLRREAQAYQPSGLLRQTFHRSPYCSANGMSAWSSIGRLTFRLLSIDAA